MVSSAPAGSVYSTPEYLDVLCSAAGGNFRILAAERGGELVGGIATYETECFWGRKNTGRLLLYYNGIIEKSHIGKYPSQQTARHTELMSALEHALSNSGYGRIQIRNRHPFRDARVFIAQGWRVRPAYSYEVQLNDLTILWDRMEHNLRRLVQRSIAEDVQFSDDDDFDSYFRLHEETCLRKRLSLYLPREAFKRYFRRLHAQGICRLFHARLPKGRAISSQMVLCSSHPVTHTISAASDPEIIRLGATAFLRWRSFQRLAELGFEANDLTDAALNPVTHFKSQLAGDLKLNLVMERPDSPGFAVERLFRQANRTSHRAAKIVLGPLLRRDHGR